MKKELNREDLQYVSGGVEVIIGKSEKVQAAKGWYCDEESVLWDGVLINRCKYDRYRKEGRTSCEVSQFTLDLSKVEEISSFGLLVEVVY